MTLFNLILNLGRAALDVLNPWVNSTPAQQVGTKAVKVVSLAVLILSLVVGAMQVVGPMIPQNAAKDAVSVPADVPAPLPESGAPDAFVAPDTFLECGEASCPPKATEDAAESEPMSIGVTFGHAALFAAKAIVGVTWGCAPVEVQSDHAIPPEVQTAIRACATKIVTSALSETCLGGCSKGEVPAKCALDCAEIYLRTSAPECADVFAGLYSTDLGAGVRAAVESSIAIIDALRKGKAPTSTPEVSP